MGSGALAQQPCIIDTFAGGSTTIFGDGGPAVEAELFNPLDVRRAPDGSLWIADSLHDVIRRVDAEGIIRTVVGNGAPGFSGDRGPALEAELNGPQSMAFAPDGTLYFYDSRNLRIRRVSTAGIIETVVGDGSTDFVGDDIDALKSGLSGAVRLAMDGGGNLVFTVGRNHRLRRLLSGGRVVTFAGKTSPPFGSFTRPTGNGGPALDADLNGPRDIAVGPDGSIYLVESTTTRRIAPYGTIDVYLPAGGLSPDGTPLEAATAQPNEIEIDSEGPLYWLERNMIRRVSSESKLETLFDNRAGFLLRVEADGTVRIIDNEAVWRLAEDTLIREARVGRRAPRGDGGSATEARFGFPTLVAASKTGEVFTYDSVTQRVRVVDPDGLIHNFAGSGEFGPFDLEGSATEAPLGRLADIAIEPIGTVLLADVTGWIGRVDTKGVLRTVVLSSGPSSSCREPTCGDGGPAIEAQIPAPRHLVADSAGNIYIARLNLDRTPEEWLRRIDAGGNIETLPSALSDGSRARKAAAIAIDTDDNLVAVTSDGLIGGYARYHPASGWHTTVQTANELLFQQV